MTPLYYKDERGDQLICLDGILIYKDNDDRLWLTLAPTPKKETIVENICDNKCGECKDFMCDTREFMEDDSR